MASSLPEISSILYGLSQFYGVNEKGIDSLE